MVYWLEDERALSMVDVMVERLVEHWVIYLAWKSEWKRVEMLDARMVAPMAA